MVPFSAMLIKTNSEVYMKLRDMIVIAMFAALTAIGAFIKIETPIVPFTLQFFFCAYSGALLGFRKALYSQLLYVGIGLIGLPVFTKGGGPAYVLQPTFGFLIGLILCAAFIGWFVEKKKTLTFMNVLLPVLGGLMIVYAVGVPYLYGIVNLYLGKPMPFGAAVAAGFTPFIGPDLIKAVIVALTAVRVVPILRRSGLVNPPAEA